MFKNSNVENFALKIRSRLMESDNILSKKLLSILRKLTYFVKLKWDRKSNQFLKFENFYTNNDRWVLDVLNRKRDGFFVEAGVMDGKEGSSTFVLEKYFGWKGILVEPGPEFKHLKRNRPESICINKILSDKKGFKDFVFFPLSKGHSCTKDSFIENREMIVRAHHNENYIPHEEMKIEAIPLVDLLEKYNAPKIIDYLSLDIEREEFKVLENFPFNKFKFRCIVLEGHSCDKLLVSKGYKKVNNKFNITAPHESYYVSNV